MTAPSRIGSTCLTIPMAMACSIASVSSSKGARQPWGFAGLSDGWIAVGSRSEVIRIRDQDGDDTAEQREVLVSLGTEQTYPHNGLTGIGRRSRPLAVHRSGREHGRSRINWWLRTAASRSVVVKEETFFVVASTAATWNDTRPDLWNPFGMYFDPAGPIVDGRQ